MRHPEENELILLMSRCRAVQVMIQSCNESLKSIMNQSGNESLKSTFQPAGQE